MNRDHLQRYAELLLKQGVNLKPGQILMLNGEIGHRELVRELAAQAYQLGAGEVKIHYSDPEEWRLLISHAEAYVIELALRERQLAWEQAVRLGAATISLRGEEFPEMFSTLALTHPEAYALFVAAQNEASHVFRDYGINQQRNAWLIAAAANSGWACQVFPDLAPEQAVERLWAVIFALTGADQEDCLARAQAQDAVLHRRAAALDALKIKELHVSGGGSDFKVGLSERARWLGGSKTYPDGRPVQVNIPTLEVYTTPDWRTVVGTVKCTRPFMAGGVMVHEAVLHFTAGELSDFQAAAGREAFARWINMDPGAKRLGEIALVGLDSPIAKSGLVFQHTLLDENALCHIAIGSAYLLPLAGGMQLSAAEQEALGRNKSRIHTDMMFSSAEVDVTALCHDGRELPLLRRGEWEPEFDF